MSAHAGLECKVITVTSWSEAKEAFGTLPIDWAFRGQRCANWSLQTSIERVVTEWADLDLATNDVVDNALDDFEQPDEQLKAVLAALPEEMRQALDVALDVALDQAGSRVKLAEMFATQRFTGSAHHYLTENLIPASKLEWLALMQHHGAPTRLLDWTMTPYVAAYFALEDANESCAVWAIDYQWCQAKGLDSLRAKDSRLGSLVNLSSPEGFERVMSLGTPGVFPAIPPRQNTRLTTQQGLFLCLGDCTKSFEENLLAYGPEVADHVCKIELPPGIRGEALADLYRMNINRATLFPGLDGFAQSIRHWLLWQGDRGFFSQHLARAKEIGPQWGARLAEGLKETVIRAATGGQGDKGGEKGPSPNS